MQLRVPDGFRIIHCPHCKWHGRSNQLQCTCGCLWYLCQMHTVDPATHRSRRPPRRPTKPKGGKVEIMPSTRPAPKVRGNDFADRAHRSKVARKNLHEHQQNLVRLGAPPLGNHLGKMSK
jgi:hypothetical protein